MKDLNLQTFSKVDKSTWHFLAEKQLKGQDPTEVLTWKNAAGIALAPYYDQSDLSQISYLSEFFQNTEPFHWKLYEEVIVEDEATANEAAVESLAGGCNGIILNIKEKVNLSAVLQNVIVDICDVSVIDRDGLLAIDSLPKNLGGFLLTQHQPTATFLEPSQDHIEGIANMIKNISTSQFILREASPDFFLEIATLRAIRFLLSDQLEEDPFAIQLHTTIPLHPSADQQWFLNATAGLASILGGTSSLSFSTAEGSSRISRNVGNLLREESGIVEYADQCGGSYYIEVLTHKVIQECKDRLR